MDDVSTPDSVQPPDSTSVGVVRAFAQKTLADGTVEHHGIVSYGHSDPEHHRLAGNLFGALKEFNAYVAEEYHLIVTTRDPKHHIDADAAAQDHAPILKQGGE
jgi:hypothetical protein